MSTLNNLLDQIDHIQFASLDAALGFRKANGGHLFVSKGASCVVWFSSRWVPSSIFMASVIGGVSGVLNPTLEQIEGLRGLVNPHAVGSVAHNHFSFYYEKSMRLSRDALHENFMALKERSQNFLNLSSSQMADADFEADVIAKVYQYRFDRPIQEHQNAAVAAIADGN